MTHEPSSADSSLASALRTLRRPWPLMAAGLACTVAGLALSQATLVPLRLVFLGAGLLLAGIAIARRLQTASWELEDRVESAALLWAACVLALLDRFNVDPNWDSAITFLMAFMIVSLVGSFLVLLPRTGRRIAAVVFVLFHFCGILAAVTSIPPRNDTPPWLATMAWSYFYRNYLFLTYFTNAYHFYSPDPGPATLVWFHIEYADGTARWKKIPNRHESPLGLHHQRMLAASESTMNPGSPPIANRAMIEQWEEKFKKKYELLPGIPHASGEEVMRRRQIGAETHRFVDPNDIDPKTQKPRPAPLLFLDEVPPFLNQYAEPMEFSRRLIASYARHIAHAFSDPSNPVKAVRVYRLTHRMMSPRELSEDKNPLDPTNFLPYYMGKYDPDGKLLDPDDPFLFWHVPIIWVSKRYPEPGTFYPSSDGPILLTHWQPTADDPGKLLNFVEIHAEQSDKFHKEKTK